MEKKPKKMKFEVQPGESLSACLDRMASQGYTPVRRMEEPVFIEVKKNGKITQEYHEQRIVFEGKLL
ncbi:hypothetical protein A374_13150 [Fictibacillus macauensis ZFHKF-1]|uniref:NETI motif-containing protein n=1 Tax=Fictibacillus macauensis ZFHKF-1 TaxID=1196324 RepID=I8IZH7_9BACL|nr:NETI motif-containing protein [Fictibacillus macauensis]EIT84901.1 hypothetical protein A374_13150 [Fictibacillus macauensis ZFHKF-1]